MAGLRQLMFEQLIYRINFRSNHVFLPKLPRKKGTFDALESIERLGCFRRHGHVGDVGDFDVISRACLVRRDCRREKFFFSKRIAVSKSTAKVRLS